MIESGYYPPGAEFDPSAPYNQVDVLPEKDFDVTCSQTLSKTVTVTTNNYTPGACGVDYEPDDEGGYCAVGWHDPDDTSDTNWNEEYSLRHETIPSLLNILKEYIKKDLEYGDSKFSKEHLEYLLEECDGWIVDEEDYIEEE